MHTCFSLQYVLESSSYCISKGSFAVLVPYIIKHRVEHNHLPCTSQTAPRGELWDVPAQENVPSSSGRCCTVCRQSAHCSPGNEDQTSSFRSIKISLFFTAQKEEKKKGILGRVFPFPPHPGIHFWQDDKKELAAAVLLVVSQGTCTTTKGSS